MTISAWYPRDKRYADIPCSECGVMFTPPSHSSLTCGPRCAHARLVRRRKLREVVLLRKTGVRYKKRIQ